MLSLQGIELDLCNSAKPGKLHARFIVKLTIANEKPRAAPSF